MIPESTPFITAMQIIGSILYVGLPLAALVYHIHDKMKRKDGSCNTNDGFYKSKDSSYNTEDRSYNTEDSSYNTKDSPYNGKDGSYNTKDSASISVVEDVCGFKRKLINN